MINNIESRDSGHLFEEVLWYFDKDGLLQHGVLVADSLERASLVKDGSVIMSGELKYVKGKERGQEMRILKFIPVGGGINPIIVSADVLSAPGKSGV